MRNMGLLQDALLSPSPPLRLPPSETMTMTEANGVWQFSYHDTAESRIVWHSFDVFGLRIPLDIPLLVCMVLPACWLILSIKTRFVGRRAARRGT
jgi:hypothetical protein